MPSLTHGGEHGTRASTPVLAFAPEPSRVQRHSTSMPIQSWAMAGRDGRDGSEACAFLIRNLVMVTAMRVPGEGGRGQCRLK